VKPDKVILLISKLTSDLRGKIIRFNWVKIISRDFESVLYTVLLVDQLLRGRKSSTKKSSILFAFFVNLISNELSCFFEHPRQNLSNDSLENLLEIFMPTLHQFLSHIWNSRKHMGMNHGLSLPVGKMYCMWLHLLYNNSLISKGKMLCQPFGGQCLLGLVPSLGSDELKMMTCYFANTVMGYSL
jgi:hypothetical protein